MSLVTATPSTTPGTRRRTAGRAAGHAAGTEWSTERSAVRPRLAVVPPESPVWSATTVPASLRVVADESEARLRARRAHPAGRGRLTSVPTHNVVALQAPVPFDQCAEPAVAPQAPTEETTAAVAPVVLRLTDRGRTSVRVAVALLLTLVVVAGVLMLGRQAQAGESAQSVPVTYRIVLPGETLWGIAGKVAPGADRRDTVDRIMDLNALSSASVSAGQRIAVPASTQP
jgi:hypothetical protein